jgi:uncharacterized protein (DUF488 family)
MHEIYRAHLEEPAAQVQLAQACEVAREQTAALLCYEADVAGCHRAIVADLIQDRIGCEVQDL